MHPGVPVGTGVPVVKTGTTGTSVVPTGSFFWRDHTGHLVYSGRASFNGGPYSGGHLATMEGRWKCISAGV